MICALNAKVTLKGRVSSASFHLECATMLSTSTALAGGRKSSRRAQHAQSGESGSRFEPLLLNKEGNREGGDHLCIREYGIRKRIPH